MVFIVNKNRTTEDFFLSGIINLPIYLIVLGFGALIENEVIAIIGFIGVTIGTLFLIRGFPVGIQLLIYGTQQARKNHARKRELEKQEETRIKNAFIPPSTAGSIQTTDRQAALMNMDGYERDYEDEEEVFDMPSPWYFVVLLPLIHGVLLGILYVITTILSSPTIFNFISYPIHTIILCLAIYLFSETQTNLVSTSFAILSTSLANYLEMIGFKFFSNNFAMLSSMIFVITAISFTVYRRKKIFYEDDEFDLENDYGEDEL